MSAPKRIYAVSELLRLLAKAGAAASGTSATVGGPTFTPIGLAVHDIDGELHSDAGGAAGEALVVDTTAGGQPVWGGIYAIAAGVPSGAPDGALPIAVDTTAVTGGIYVWDGAAWVKAATI